MQICLHARILQCRRACFPHWPLYGIVPGVKGHYIGLNPGRQGRMHRESQRILSHIQNGPPAGFFSLRNDKGEKSRETVLLNDFSFTGIKRVWLKTARTSSSFCKELRTGNPIRPESHWLRPSLGLSDWLAHKEFFLRLATGSVRDGN